jgi:Arylsulfotransferase (ASST)
VGMFPPAMGLAKFDKDSNVLWKNPGLLHHWFSVGPNGEIYIPARKTGTSPMTLPDREKEIICDQVGFGYDSIEVLDAKGRKIREIDTLEALVNSDLTGLFNSNQEQPDTVQTCDPTHLNDAQVLTGEMAEQYPRFKAGDLLVSFRTLNAIAVLDPETGLFKWHFQGPSHHQHSPRFLGNNVIVFLDNLGGQVSRGTSRILAVKVDSGAFESAFPKAGMKLPGREFKTKNAGSIDISPAGDRILVSWTRKGLVSEINVRTGELLWEFVNTHTVDNRPARISTYTAKYVPQLTFEMNGGRLD